MDLSRLAGAIALGFGLLSVGCLGTADDFEAEDVDSQAYGIYDDPNGSSGNNGLNPTNFHNNITFLYQIMNMPLEAPGVPPNAPMQTNTQINQNVIDTGIFNTAAGEELFRYVAQCVWPKEHFLQVNVNDPTLNNIGSGFLETVKSWRGAALNEDQKGDLLACMLTLLNNTNVTVPIRLTGEAIEDSLTPIPGYGFQEALWVALPPTAPGSGPYSYHVWPLPDLEGECGPVTSEWLQFRVCGDVPQKCNLTVENQLTHPCTQSPDGNYTCLGQPAIKSYLKADGMSQLDPANRCYFDRN